LSGDNVAEEHGTGEETGKSFCNSAREAIGDRAIADPIGEEQQDWIEEELILSNWIGNELIRSEDWRI
jgi:hypothetical protein